MDDFEVVPGFSGEAVTVYLIHDLDGWNKPGAEFPAESEFWTYTIRERIPDGAADESFVVPTR